MSAVGYFIVDHFLQKKKIKVTERTSYKVIATIFYAENPTYFTTWKNILNNCSIMSWKSMSRQILNDLTNAKL